MTEPANLQDEQRRQVEDAFEVLLASVPLSDCFVPEGV